MKNRMRSVLAAVGIATIAGAGLALTPVGAAADARGVGARSCPNTKCDGAHTCIFGFSMQCRLDPSEKFCDVTWCEPE